MEVMSKLRLAIDAKDVEMTFKQGYQIVHAEFLWADKEIRIWVEQNMSGHVPEVDVMFSVIKSNEPLAEGLTHVATLGDEALPETYHLYQRVKRGVEAPCSSAEQRPSTTVA